VRRKVPGMAIRKKHKLLGMLVRQRTSTCKKDHVPWPESFGLSSGETTWQNIQAVLLRCHVSKLEPELC